MENDEGAKIEDQQVEQGVDEGIGAKENQFSDPTSDEIKSMYDELGIKAKVPTGKSKGRPKADDIGDKKVTKKDDADSEFGKRKANDDGEGGDETPSDTHKDRGNGDDADKETPKDGKNPAKDREKDPEISEDTEDNEDGVQKTESGDNEETGEAGGEDAEDPDVKRPGKSNPKVEQRFQKLSNEIRERDEVINQLQSKLQEAIKSQNEFKTSQEDPEYTVDDFRRVRDEYGNVLDLDDNEAELAWRRWKDGYNQRKIEREAEFNHTQQMQIREQETAEKLMRSSAEAYDTLIDIRQSYPELDSNSPQFDKSLSDSVLPIIEDMIIYQPGTEPGNNNNSQPVVVGLKMNPKTILSAIKQIKDAKRSIPLNGISNNVDSVSNIKLSQNGRSSDPLLNSVNQMYKDLGINKRF